jgi:toxin ParE1/3/4
VKIPVVMTQPALDAAQEARDWYEGRQQGLGDRFTYLLEHTIERISDMPRAFPEVQPDVRRALVPVFNYRVFYLVDAEVVTVIGVYHPARNIEGLI